MSQAGKFKELYENVCKAIALIFRSDRRLSVLHLFLLVIVSVLPLLLLYAVRYLVDAVEQMILFPSGHIPAEVWVILAVFCLIYLLNRCFSILDNYIAGLLGEKTVNDIQRRIQKQSAELDLSYYDTPSYYDAMYMAQQEAANRPLQLLAQLTGLITELITLVGVIVILASFSFWSVAVMLLAGLPSFAVYLHRVRVMYAWRKGRIKDNRQANYHSTLLTNRNFAKEIRSYGMISFVQERFWAIRSRLYRQRKKISKETSLLSGLTCLLDVAAVLLIMYLLLHNVLLGLLTVGSFVMYFQAFRKGGSAMQSLVGSLSGIYENHLFLTNLFHFLELEHHISSPEAPQPFPNEIREGIRFEQVSFRYPDSAHRVLDKVDYTFVPGEINCLSGVNGMGKTTMMKLLCRLYECEEGRITIDGTDIRRFDLQELRENIAVIFQDFIGYAFTAEENITVGKRTEDTDREYFRQVVCAAGADKVLDKLPKAEKTLLGKLFEGGEELSMGQWQRIALARALYKNSPVLILDEPTSWMDVEGKRNFKRYLSQWSKERLVILVSHEEK